MRWIYLEIFFNAAIGIDHGCQREFYSSSPVINQFFGAAQCNSIAYHLAYACVRAIAPHILNRIFFHLNLKHKWSQIGWTVLMRCIEEKKNKKKIFASICERNIHSTQFIGTQFEKKTVTNLIAKRLAYSLHYSHKQIDSAQYLDAFGFVWVRIWLIKTLPQRDCYWSQERERSIDFFSDTQTTTFFFIFVLFFYKTSSFFFFFWSSTHIPSLTLMYWPFNCIQIGISMINDDQLRCSGVPAHMDRPSQWETKEICLRWKCLITAACCAILIWWAGPLRCAIHRHILCTLCNRHAMRSGEHTCVATKERSLMIWR